MGLYCPMWKQKASRSVEPYSSYEWPLAADAHVNLEPSSQEMGRLHTMRRSMTQSISPAIRRAVIVTTVDHTL